MKRRGSSEGLGNVFEGWGQAVGCSVRSSQTLHPTA